MRKVIFFLQYMGPLSKKVSSPFAVRGDRQPGGVAVTGDYALVDGKHAPNHDLLLLHILVAAQVELGLQLARGGRRGATANVRKEAYSEQKASESHATST